MRLSGQFADVPQGGGRRLGLLHVGLLAMGLALGCGASQSAGVEVDGGRSFTVPEGSFVEANLTMAAGSSVTAVWRSAGVVVDWNVHSHPDTGLVTHDQGNGVSGTIVFTPLAAGPYSLMWERARARTELIVDLRISGEASVEWVAP